MDQISSTKKRKNYKKTAAGATGILLLLFLIPLCTSKFVLKLSSYGIKIDLDSLEADCGHVELDPECLICNPQGQIRIIQLTDLHNSVFGRENQRLINKIQAQNPDMILMTGDMINDHEEAADVVAHLVSELSKIAPVYYSYGNHEAAHEQNWNTDLVQIMTAAGATVLERSYVDTEIKGMPVRIGGIYGYCLPDMESGEDFEDETLFLQEFQDTERCKILLCHMPVCWMINGSLDYWDIDLVFAGHAHGGQVVLPLLGGLYAPDQGWFPGDLEGVFSSEDGKRHLVLSSGLGSEGIVPRWNNLPEILQVDLKSWQ